jgi:hypothetical protein
MLKYSLLAIVTFVMLQVTVKTFNYFGIYFSLIPAAVTIVGLYLFINNQLKKIK